MTFLGTTLKRYTGHSLSDVAPGGRPGVTPKIVVSNVATNPFKGRPGASGYTNPATGVSVQNPNAPIAVKDADGNISLVQPDVKPDVKGTDSTIFTGKNILIGLGLLITGSSIYYATKK